MFTLLRAFTLLISFFLLACGADDEFLDSNEETNTGAPEITVTPAIIPTMAAEVDDSPTGVNVEPDFLFEDFESGWGIFLDGGLSATLSSENTFSGNTSVRMFGDSGIISSFVQRTPMNLTNADFISVNFWMLGEGLVDGDALSIDFSDGEQWQTVARLVSGVDFSSDIYTEFSFGLSNSDYLFSQVARFRFVSETTGSPIYMDTVSISIVRSLENPAQTPIFIKNENITFDHIGVESGCSGCHNNRIWEGKSASHIASSNECQFCHIGNNVAGWETFTYTSGTFDHTDTETYCFDCHNGTLAATKPIFHIESSNECEQCHAPVVGGWNLFEPGRDFLHEGIVTACVSCHDGGVAVGQADNHIPSSDDCEDCHAPNQPWGLLVFPNF